MKIILTFLFSACLIVLVGCSDTDNTKYRKAEKAPQTNAPVSPAQPLNAQKPAEGQGAAVAVNPPHGQPNHRCDIPEGAPLSTPMQPNLNTAPQFRPQPMPQPMPEAQGTVAPGINPPHGQPGHDCAIPVGAPLSKK
ncbi:hypothetical protein ACMA1I_06590 [Pontibacter sp. 13R65]|uniref:hypothetical protein n=1 Tax=Pontibacter sp. 13R65 TaxID=3127458 RepID=UPI00301D875C